MSLDQALAYARKGRGRRVRSATGWACLTSSERVVADLLGRGLMNREIADRLVVSPRTVESHVSHVLRKLRIGSRRELVRELCRRPPLAQSPVAPSERSVVTTDVSEPPAGHSSG